jgi:hypothetical protein
MTPWFSQELGVCLEAGSLEAGTKFGRGQHDAGSDVELL